MENPNINIFSFNSNQTERSISGLEAPNKRQKCILMNSSNFDTVTLVIFALFYKKEDAIHDIQFNNTIIEANLIYASKVTHFNFYFQ